MVQYPTKNPFLFLTCAQVLLCGLDIWLKTSLCLSRKQFAERLEVIAYPERKRRRNVGIALGVCLHVRIYLHLLLLLPCMPVLRRHCVTRLHQIVSLCCFLTSS